MVTKERREAFLLKLRNEVEKSGLSTDDICEKVNISKIELYRLVNGMRYPSVRVAWNLSVVLDVDFNKFVDYEWYR